MWPKSKIQIHSLHYRILFDASQFFVAHVLQRRQSLGVGETFAMDEQPPLNVPRRLTLFEAPQFPAFKLESGVIALFRPRQIDEAAHNRAVLYKGDELFLRVELFDLVDFLLNRFAIGFWHV